jgi:hypothetical protein
VIHAAVTDARLGDQSADSEGVDAVSIDDLQRGSP